MSKKDDIVINISSEEQLQQILEKYDNVIIDFFAIWCGPCKKISPVIHDLANKYKDKYQKNNLVFIKIDVDECPDLARKYEIEAMPTFIGIKKGKQVDKVKGASIVNITKMVEKLI